MSGLDREKLAEAFDRGFQEAGRRLAAPFGRLDAASRTFHLGGIDAILSSIAEQGYVVVPREATDAMLKKVYYGSASLLMCEDSMDIKEAWTAMIQAQEGGE